MDWVRSAFIYNLFIIIYYFFHISLNMAVPTVLWYLSDALENKFLNN